MSESMSERHHRVRAEGAGATGATPSSMVRRLPLPTRIAGLVLLACAGVPPAALVLAEVSSSRLAVAASTHPNVVNGVVCLVAMATLLAFERPRSASPVAYARQLRARFLELQSTYDADSRRRPEGKEKEDDLEVPPEP